VFLESWSWATRKPDRSRARAPRAQSSGVCWGASLLHRRLDRRLAIGLVIRSAAFGAVLMCRFIDAIYRLLESASRTRSDRAGVVSASIPDARVSERAAGLLRISCGKFAIRGTQAGALWVFRLGSSIVQFPLAWISRTMAAMGCCCLHLMAALFLNLILSEVLAVAALPVAVKPCRKREMSAVYSSFRNVSAF